MPQRYYGAKDLATIEKFNRELLGEPNISDDGIIDQFVILYRVSVYETETNMYGEASEGKVYKQGVKLPCIVDASPLIESQRALKLLSLPSPPNIIDLVRPIVRPLTGLKENLPEIKKGFFIARLLSN